MVKENKVKEEPQIEYQWVSWISYKEFGDFTLYFPWWVSGYQREEGEEEFDIIVAALPFKKIYFASPIICDSYDDSDKFYQASMDGNKEVFRFIETKIGSPFSEKFPRKDWMWWPNIETVRKHRQTFGR